MKLLVLIALLLAAAVGSSPSGGSAMRPTKVMCRVPGEWPFSVDGVWLWRALRRAGYGNIGCTGSAFTITAGPGPRRRGRDLDIWAFRSPRLPGDVVPRWKPASVRGRRVYVARDGWGVAWRACGRTVWLRPGPTSRRLPPLARLARPVSAAQTAC